jgi:hypothetical protein
MLAIVTLVHDLDPGPWIAGGIAALGLYFLMVGLSDRWMINDRTSH